MELVWYRCSHCHIPVHISPEHLLAVEQHHARKSHRGNPNVRLIQK